MPSDYSDAPTLGLTMMTAFVVVAKRYGVRIEGIEYDANEYSDFFQQVARQMLADDPPRRAVSSSGARDTEKAK